MTNGDVGSQNKWKGQIACFWEVPREVRDFITQLSWTLYIIYKTHSALKGVCVGGGDHTMPLVPMFDITAKIGISTIYH